VYSVLIIMMYWLSRSRAPWLGTFGYDAVIAHAPHTSAQQLSALDAAVRGGSGGGGRLLTSPPLEWGAATADGAELPVEMSAELPIGRALAERAAVRGQTGWAAGQRGEMMIPKSGGGGDDDDDGESGSNSNWRAARQATACFMSSGGTAAAASHVAAVVGERDARAPWATSEAVSVATVATAATATTAATSAAAATATTASSAAAQTRVGGRHAAGGAVPSSSTARRLFHAAEPELLPVPPSNDPSQGRTELAAQPPWPPARCQPQERHEAAVGASPGTETTRASQHSATVAMEASVGVRSAQAARIHRMSVQPRPNGDGGGGGGGGGSHGGAKVEPPADHHGIVSAPSSPFMCVGCVG
jgi:hypothetical protein